MDAVDQHRAYAPTRLGFAAVTVSDSRTAGDDTSGATIRERVVAAGHTLVGAQIVRDERPLVLAALDESLAVDGCDAVLFTGGTGFAPRDVTVDALAARFDREVRGFGELVRALSFEEIGAAAMLSRATAGVVGRQLVYALPGSPKAVRLALDRLILPETAHLLGQLRR